MKREKIIVRTGFIGIVANVFLAAFKGFVGFLSGSIAVTLDAVNNLSDALSSVITIVSTKLANKKPDKKHPFGLGRLEYLSAGLIAVIVLYAGFMSLTESVKKIFAPEAADYSVPSLVIIAVAVAVKIVLGLYVTKTGRRVKSESLIASGKDALLDAVISASTLLAAVIFLIWGLSSLILGKRVEGELARSVRHLILGFPEVSGVFDLILHNYGPERYIGSVHIELPADLTVAELDLLERRISEKVYEKTGVALTGISVYAQTGESGFAGQVFRDVRDAVGAESAVLQLHGFSVDEERKEIRFDVVIDYNAKDRSEIFTRISDKIKRQYPDYTVCPTMDVDSADL